jgi:hypothetical protein
MSKRKVRATYRQFVGRITDWFELGMNDTLDGQIEMAVIEDAMLSKYKSW